MNWRNLMKKTTTDSTRRWFLVKASAAAACVSIGGEAAGARSAAAETAGPGGVEKFTAADLRGVIAGLDASPGNKTIVDEKTFVVMLTVEKHKAQAEFEWHEGRDHVFQIIDGATVIEVGGTPKGAHSSKAGEWNAPESEGAEKISLSKGDLLVIPRGVPHRRTTEGSVTLMLISPQGSEAIAESGGA